MNRWAIAISGVVVGFILGLVFAFFFVPLKLEWVPTEQNELTATLPPPNSEEIAMEQAVYEPDWPAFETRWADAPETIRELARVIAKGEVPQGLDHFEPAVLSRGYHAPALDFTRDDQPVQYLATLLQEAVMAYNLEAVQMLLAQGVDPNVNHTEALFMAIERRTLTAPAFMLFPDFDASLPIVQALLDAGANPNVQQYGFRYVTPLSLTNTVTNLGAMIALINAGADPWMQPDFLNGMPSESLMETLVFSAGEPASAEILFRVLRATTLPPGPPEQVDHVFAQLEQRIKTFAMGSGPDSRHTAWRLDQVLTLAGRVFERQAEADRIRARLSEFSYQADGGWYLTEDEIHSRYDAPLSVPDRGDHVWGP